MRYSTALLGVYIYILLICGFLSPEWKVQFYQYLSYLSLMRGVYYALTGETAGDSTLMVLCPIAVKVARFGRGESQPLSVRLKYHS